MLGDLLLVDKDGRLAGLIDNLLFVARAEDPRTQITKKPLDVGQELATVRDFYEAAAAEAGVRLNFEASAGLIAARAPLPNPTNRRFAPESYRTLSESSPSLTALVA